LLHPQNPLLDARISEIPRTYAYVELAHFVSNFISIAMRVSRVKIRLAAVAGPFLKTSI